MTQAGRPPSPSDSVRATQGGRGPGRPLSMALRAGAGVTRSRSTDPPWRDRVNCELSQSLFKHKRYSRASVNLFAFHADAMLVVSLACTEHVDGVTVLQSKLMPYRMVGFEA